MKMKKPLLVSGGLTSWNDIATLLLGNKKGALEIAEKDMHPHRDYNDVTYENDVGLLYSQHDLRTFFGTVEKVPVCLQDI